MIRFTAVPSVLLASFLFFSCETLRKTPTSSTTRRPATASTARKPAPARPARPTTTTPPYSRPAGPYDKRVHEVVKVARTYTGTPYRSGGNDKRGIDCSGLICSVYSQVGFKVPRVSWQQSEFGKEIVRVEDIRPGDWLFFVPDAGKEGYVSHAGIVTEVRGRQEVIFIHASTSRGVREDNLYSNYFKNRFVKAMRPF
ncbi:C40 family peptidase [Telluribacter sp. SYSU D00476]|uniref:C40 family peptidase n=1 Tax=Telluribacter sp. SYSU D00476 TaxID=2811430 RepID=UPI001FF59243|nr:C40 family peptidase [Telluribacter sp. SYSU D00476]